MRFHGLMVVRDEEDIIEQSLTSTLSWIDSLYVIDTGSTDGTWEAILDRASKDQRICPVARRSMVFSELLRAELFDRFRHKFEDGDWVVKLDVDEFYHVSPPDFVTHFIREFETCVYLQWYFFRLTTQELRAYKSGLVDVSQDRRRPIEERRRFYKLTEHSEPRMFKYRRAMKWSCNGSFPHHAGYVAENRIPIRHYPHRDPEQMGARYALRSLMKRYKSDAGAHWNTDDWKQDVVLYEGDLGAARERSSERTGLSADWGHTSGPLHYWAHGTSLPDVTNTTHLKKTGYRFFQRGLHRFFLPLADRLHRGFDGGSGLIASLTNIEDLSASESERTA